jgi:hypothetical protein
VTNGKPVKSTSTCKTKTFPQFDARRFYRKKFAPPASRLLVAKTGIRGANDLVWVGRAANYAAKLSNLNGYPTYITDSVYGPLSNEAKFSNGVDMWTKLRWIEMNDMTIYATNYWWLLPN